MKLCYLQFHGFTWLPEFGDPSRKNDLKSGIYKNCKSVFVLAHVAEGWGGWECGIRGNSLQTI